jgi:lysophospholipid acyltransferase (LPLAT)-like uncharacterized protein
MSSLASGRGYNNLLISLKQFRRRITYSEKFMIWVSGMVWLLYKLYLRTLKIRFYEHPDIKKLHPDKRLYGFWHGRQFLLIPVFGYTRSVIMVDISWAGEILSYILKRFGFSVARGSSKRKSVQALLTMKKKMEEGCPGAIALDGPTGPFQKAKPGLLFLAAKMNLPVVPLTVSCSRGWVLKSTWDRYIVPRPFTRCMITMGKPLYVQKRDVERGTDRLDGIINGWVDWTDRLVGWVSDS